MIDREKIIRGLECCSFAWNIAEPPNCKNCPYADTEFGTCQIPNATLIDDTLELLKKDQIELAELQATLDLANGKLINMGYEAYNCDDGRDTLKNAIKAIQEPRVLTLEEVKNLDDHDVVYIETTIGDPINPAIYQPDNGDDDYACIVSTWLKSGFYSWSTYGKEWRCWSSKPTDEQKEAVPWTE